MQYDNSKKYYAAYDERYKTAHAKGVSWASSVSTPIVLEILEKYGIGRQQPLLEIGCGEGRDSRAVLDAGYALMSPRRPLPIAKSECRNMKTILTFWIVCLIK